MHLRPMNKNVVVERIASEKVTESGIILKSAQGPDFAKVLHHGNVTDVKAGEKVLLDWNKATKIEGDRYLISVDSIIGVIE